ncbi:FAD-binding oxidoreductase [Thiomonas sp.]
MSDTRFLTRLRDAVGVQAVLTSDEAIAPWLSDWRGLYQGRAQAVLRPQRIEQVQACLALCQEFQVPVIPRGGNTGLCGGATPGASPDNVVLSLDRMNRIRSLNTTANTLVAEAGCVLADLQNAAADAGRLLPLSLAAEGTCQLGGNLATNAGGVNVLRYGMARDLVLGIEAVLPGGEVFHGLRTLRKDNTGYDLKQLLIGSEGTLGVITAAALRLFPPILHRTVVIAAVESPQHALLLYALLFARCGASLQAFEYFTGECVDLVVDQVPGIRPPFSTRHPGYVLVELSGADEAAELALPFENIIGSALEGGICLDAVVSASLEQLRQMWRLREDISEALRADGHHLKHDVSLPIENIPEFIERAGARVRAVDTELRLYVFGHFGDGNLHVNLARPRGAPEGYFAAQGARLSAELLDEVDRHGGSISAEHGIGQLKRDAFEKYKSPIELDLMRKIKQVFDPSGIMNPGKLFESRRSFDAPAADTSASDASRNNR